MNTGMRAFIFPLVLIAIGVAWLVSSLGYETSIWNWAISATLIAFGVGTISAGGINRQTLVTGPFLIMLGILWLLYAHFGISGRILVPCGLIGFGIILGGSRMPGVPANPHSDEQMNARNRAANQSVSSGG